jgi:hypothetical protein
MAGSRAEKSARRRLLAGLACELSQPDGLVRPLRPRMRCTVRLVPYLSLPDGARGRLRVYCVSDAGLYAFLTGDGQLIRLADGVPGAAQVVAALCRPDDPAKLASHHPPAAQPRS